MTTELDAVPISSLADVNPPRELFNLRPDSEVSFIPMQDVSEEGEWTGEQTRCLNDVKAGYTPFLERDVLFAKITPCMENGKGAHARGLLSGVGFGSTEFHILRARGDVDDRFIYHWSRSPALRLRAQAFMIGSAGQQRVQPEFFDFFRVPLLPAPEQSRIAVVLDTLDDAIRRTEQVIAKLRQMKQGLLHDLLTRGVDAHGDLRSLPEEAPDLYKDSPLGRIPAAWGTAHLRDVSTLITSGSRGWAAYYSDDGPLFLRIANLTREQINLRFDSTVFVRPPAGSEGRRTAVEPGDLLISITADLGVIGVVPDGLGEAYVNQHVALVRLDRSQVNSRWIAQYLAGTPGRRQFRKLNDMGAKAGLNLPTVGKLLVALPGLSEQHAIAAVIDSVDQSIRREEVLAEKARTFRRGLLHDLLTGRVRVPLAVEVSA